MADAVIDQAFKGRELMNVPGRPEVWRIGDSWRIVYMVPGSEDDPVYLIYRATSYEDVKSWFGPGKTPTPDRLLTTAQYRKMGGIEAGNTDEIPPGADNPFNAWAGTLRIEAQTQPWILDDDYQALMAQALIESRELTEAEIATTKWWKTHNAAQRNWMVVYHGDKKTADQMITDARTRIRDLLRSAGAGVSVTPEIINYIADRQTKGDWTATYTNDQIKALVDPYAKIKLDAGLAALNRTSVSRTQAGEAEVRDLLSTWLGPQFGQRSATEIAKIAGEIRNDPDRRDIFVEQLKDQRMALLPEYTDRELSYAAIANNWRQWWIGQWGEVPDETDSLFIKVLRNNDTDESAKLLRREGLARGISKVKSTLSQQTLSQLGDTERQVITNG